MLGWFGWRRRSCGLGAAAAFAAAMAAGLPGLPPIFRARWPTPPWRSDSGTATRCSVTAFDLFPLIQGAFSERVTTH